MIILLHRHTFKRNNNPKIEILYYKKILDNKTTKMSVIKICQAENLYWKKKKIHICKQKFGTLHLLHIIVMREMFIVHY